MLFLTADWHLGEDRLSLIQRPFKSIDEHIDCLVERHNSVVNANDEVIVVGDVVYQHKPEYVDHISRFNGKKTLIRGNHDRKISDEIYLKYFDNIIKEGGGLSLVIEGIKCYVTHYPTCGVSDAFNLVGHVHSTWKYQLNMLNVGVDVHHFYPVSAEKIPFYFKAIDKYDDDVWVSYSELNSQFYNKRGSKGRYFNEA